MLDHKTYMSVGHDEYWSGGQRTNVEAARDAGVNLAFFSGNESFWKTRWENSIDGSGADHRTLVSYKETHANAKIDPTASWTGTWRDPRQLQSRGRQARERAQRDDLHGQRRHLGDPGAGGGGQAQAMAQHERRLARPGQTATLADGTLGYEWDEDLDNGARPAGLVDISSTTVDVPQRLLDYGSTYGPGTATHSLTLYRAPSGALVFGAGTIQWSWGLDGTHDRGGSTPDPRMQQATVNLLADMGAQPTTLQGGLVPATASTDTAAPSSEIDSPSAGSDVESGEPTTISGTATDSGGGRVGGVEVSVDGGATWHPAKGRESWTLHLDPRRSRHGDDQDPRRRRQREPRGPGSGGDGRRHAADLPLLDLERQLHAHQRQRSKRGRGRGQVPLRRARLGHRASLLQDGGQHGTHIGQPVDARTAPNWPRPPSPARRPRAGRT